MEAFEHILQEVVGAVAPGDGAAAVAKRKFVLDQCNGLTLQVVAKLQESFWLDAAKTMALVQDEPAAELAPADVTAKTKRWRAVLASTGAACSAECATYLANAAEKAKRLATKQPEVNLPLLIQKVKDKVGFDVPISLLPSAKMVAAVKDGKFVELAEFRTTFVEKTEGTETMTSVQGELIQVLKPRKKAEDLFVPSSEIAGCLLRWAMAVWIANPEGNFLQLLAYVMKVLSFGNQGWGRAMFYDRSHRQSVPSRLALKPELSIFDVFMDEIVNESFSEARLKFTEFPSNGRQGNDGGSGKSHKGSTSGKGISGGKAPGKPWSAKSGKTTPYSKVEDKKGEKKESGDVKLPK